MPGYIIHLTEAQLIINLLKSQKNLPVIIDEEWKKLFFCGNLIPDAVPGNRKGISHFLDEETRGRVLELPSICKFLDKYKIDIKNPLLYGYFIHLCLDRTFFENYMGKFVKFCNSKNKEERIADKIVYVRILKTEEKISIDKFFSEEYLYGDYTKLNQYFLNRYQIQIPWNIILEENSIIEEAKPYDLGKVFEELQSFLQVTMFEEDKDKLAVFSRDDMNRFLTRISREMVDNLIKDKIY